MRAFFGIFLSMAALLAIVNASAEDSPSVNQSSKAASAPTAKREEKREIPRLVQTVLNTGDQKDFPNGYAQAVGLEEAMPAKRCHITLSGDGKVWEDRHVFVVYANEEPARPVCIFLMRGHASKHELKQEFFRVNLNGELEKAVVLQNNRDDEGKSIAEGRARIEEDLADSATRKTFQTEMSYWLKTWLKKQPKVAIQSDKTGHSAQ